MISYSRDSQETIPASAVKIVGLGGAGANMLERIALDGLEGAELLALNTDVRTLGASLAKEKIQLGTSLTKGLGTGGDPELGQQAVLEAEDEVRNALKGQSIVFLCVGLGGGTGSGAAPIISRIAREEGAFVVVFATMPFLFEGRRRSDQANTALNQLAVLSHALVTFENNRMGELVLAKQGIHEAFSAADKMISESIKAVIRLVVRPGLINVGLDDLMSALRTTRSRCLFGSGIADGKDRASKALRNALASPLLDQGSLLSQAQTVLVHLSGGESLTLFEIELLMRSLQKHVPEHAHVLFGAAIDPGMGDNLSVTLISALPEDVLIDGPMDSQGSSDTSQETLPEAAPTAQMGISSGTGELAADQAPNSESVSGDVSFSGNAVDTNPEKSPASDTRSSGSFSNRGLLTSLFVGESKDTVEGTPSPEAETTTEPGNAKEDRPFAEFISKPGVTQGSGHEDKPEAPEKDGEPTGGADEIGPSKSNFTSISTPQSSEERTFWGKSDSPARADTEEDGTEEDETELENGDAAKSDGPELKLGSKRGGGQSELSFDSAPRGRFEGENPNVVDGEDLDLPPFLRKKKS